MDSARRDSRELVIRGFQRGDEARIVDLINTSYPTPIVTPESWQWTHTSFPTFRPENEFIAEVDARIVGYRALYLRDMVLGNTNVSTIMIGSTATAPDKRGEGIYSRLHQAALEAARRQAIAVVLTSNSVGSITYNHNLKTGFAAMPQTSHMIVLNAPNYVRRTLRQLAFRNVRFRSLLEHYRHGLAFVVDGQVVSAQELLGDNIVSHETATNLRIIIQGDAVPLLYRIRQGSVARRACRLAHLVLLRRIRIAANSLPTLLGFARRVVRILV